MKQWLYENRCGLTVFSLAVLILLPFLGSIPLLDPDEPVYGQTAREMLLAGDWLSPRIYGNYWYDKPPLFYWLEMASYSLFDISDWSSRLPSALAAAATVCYIYIQGKEIFNKPIAFISAIILLTSVGFVYVGKGAVTDMTLMLTLTVALLSFYQEKYYTAYAFCGFAMLTKGPIGCLFPAAIMMLYIITGRRWQLIKTMKIPQGLVLAGLIGLPWYAAMYQVHGDVFLQTFIGLHNIIRFVAPEHPGKNSLFFFIPIFAGAMMPWTAALYPALRRFVKKRDPFKDAVQYCLIWILFIFVFFSFSKTQLITYIVPVFPPAAYLIGWHIYRCFCENKQPRDMAAISYVLAILLLLCNTIPLNNGAEFFRPAILAGSALLSAALFVPAMFLYRRQWKYAFTAVVTAMLLFFGVMSFQIMPAIAKYASSTNTANRLQSIYDGHSALYVENFLCPGIAFYSGIYGTSWDDQAPPDFASILHVPGKAYIVMTKRSFFKLSKTIPELQQYSIAAELPAQVILTNHS